MCSCDQSLVTLAFLWEKLSQPQFYRDLTRKTTFFDGWSWFKFNKLGLALFTNLKFYTSVAKGLKLKVIKIWGLIPTFVDVTRKKLVWGAFLHPPPPPLSWIGLKVHSDLKIYRYIFLHIKNNMLKVSHYNSICFLSSAHPRYIKYLFTNIQKQ